MVRELERRHEVACHVAREAGKLLLTYWGNRPRVTSKGAIDFVSEADEAAEEYLREGLLREFPEDGFLGEEGDSIEGTSGYCWVVDPLDGTTNFIHGHPHYAVSVGLMRSGIPQSGVIFAPHYGELFDAFLGGGARCNGDAIQVSSATHVETSLLATGFPYNRREILPELLAPFSAVIQRARGVRRAGAAALDLAYVAAGRVDGFWERGLNPWDVAAGWVLVTEAGGLVTDLDGGSFELDAWGLLATNGTIHAELLPILHVSVSS